MDTTTGELARPGFTALHPVAFALIDGPLVALGAAALWPRAGRRLCLRPSWLTRRLALGLLGTIAAAHLVEAATAWRQARRRGLDAPRWAAQTALAGAPSLLALHAQPGSEWAEEAHHHRIAPKTRA
jgi:hypothetical protein